MHIECFYRFGFCKLPVSAVACGRSISYNWDVELRYWDKDIYICIMILASVILGHLLFVNSSSAHVYQGILAVGWH